MMQEQRNILKVEKEFKSYLKTISTKDKSSKSQSQITYKKFFSNPMLMVVAIRNGIPLSLFLSIKDASPYTDTDWADFLNLSIKSLQRYKKDKNHVFKSIHSEKIIELAEVTALGREVFDETEQFYQWLKTPSFALGKMKPVELLKDSYGKEMVLSELHRIDQGIFA